MLDVYRKPSIPFQSKHLSALKRDTWYVLRRPEDRSRSGFLCVWPQRRCCVYVAAHQPNGKHATPRIALLRLRVDPQFLSHDAGLTVFAATLSPAARRLWIEDCLMWKGRDLFNTDLFSQRLAMSVQWLSHYCIADERLLSGVTMEIAAWSALKELTSEGVWDIQSDSVAQRRLLWISTAATTSIPPPSAPAPAPTPSSRQKPPTQPTQYSNSICHVPTATAPIAEKPVSGSLTAIARREPGPDQWALVSADEKLLGKALIRRLDISSELRSLKATVARVSVAWNTVFKKWEITGITADTASHSSLFVPTAV
jgi:hypothetical protein